MLDSIRKHRCLFEEILSTHIALIMELSSDLPVSLIIKAPNQRIADQTIHCVLGWTIKKLKRHLEIVYPTRPKHNEQRLIYSGRLLQDHLTLQEILHQYDLSLSNTLIVHLVCTPAVVSTSSTCTLLSQNSPKVTASSAMSSSHHSSETIHADTHEDIRYSQYSQMSGPSTSYGPASTYNALSLSRSSVQGDWISYTPVQYAWMIQQQQIYLLYMLHYILYYQSFCNLGLSFTHLPPSTRTQQHEVGSSHLQQLQQAQEGAVPNNDAQRAGLPNIRMNAQGEMEEDDDDEPRDWLHHMYFCLRILTFIGILFFYSNLTRFLIVFSGSFAIYILQKLRKYMQIIQEQDNEQRQQEQTVRNEEAQPQQTEAASNHQLADNDSFACRIKRIFIFIFSTIQSFFASMLPTPPELLEPH